MEAKHSLPEQTPLEILSERTLVKIDDNYETAAIFDTSDYNPSLNETREEHPRHRDHIEVFSQMSIPVSEANMTIVNSDTQ